MGTEFTPPRPPRKGLVPRACQSISSYLSSTYCVHHPSDTAVTGNTQFACGSLAASGSDGRQTENY